MNALSLKLISMALNLDFIDLRPHHLKRSIKQVGNAKLKSNYSKVICGVTSQN